MDIKQLRTIQHTGLPFVVEVRVRRRVTYSQAHKTRRSALKEMKRFQARGYTDVCMETY